MLTEEMKTLIRNYAAGSVATVNADGTPSVSPKATFVILDDTKIAFANIRSPGTVMNLRRNSAIEVCFTDVLKRLAVRVTGSGTVVLKKDAGPELLAPFEAGWDYLVDHMSAFITIDITAAEMILSPAYDRGITEQELVSANLEKLNRL